MARRVGSATKSSKTDALARKQGSDSGEEITRCICGNDEFVSTARTKALNASPGLYVQCERCNVWQHGFCMGFLTEDDVPNEYYCELCEPTFHRVSHRGGVLMSKYRPFQSASSQQAASSTSAAVEATTAEQKDHPRTKKESDAEQSAKSEDSESQSHADDDSADGHNSTDAAPNAGKKTAANGNHHQSTSIKQEDALANGKKSAENTNMENGKKELSPAVLEEAKKRARRADNDSSTSAGSRNRKRRSREDEILQRVLEESAREAREAEERRRSLEGAPSDSAQEDEHNENQNDDEDDGEFDDSAKPLRAKRSRSSATTSSATEVKRREMVRNGSSAGRPARGGRAGRGGRRGGSRSASYGTDPLSPSSPSSSRRTANGVKKCKPRIPSQKTTFEEMRRRVASILEYSSRIQDELTEEQQRGISALQRSAPNTGKVDSSIKQLSHLCDQNFANLEELTRKLLKWEEQFGIKP